VLDEILHEYSSLSNNFHQRLDRLHSGHDIGERAFHKRCDVVKHILDPTKNVLSDILDITPDLCEKSTCAGRR
jgi:hypothetical protein